VPGRRKRALGLCNCFSSETETFSNPKNVFVYKQHSQTNSNGSIVIPPRSELDGIERVALLVLSELQRRNPDDSRLVNNALIGGTVGAGMTSILVLVFGVAAAPAFAVGGIAYAVAGLWGYNRDQAAVAAADEKRKERAEAVRQLQRAGKIIGNTAPALKNAASDEDVIKWLDQAYSAEIDKLAEALGNEFHAAPQSK
jgi:hypothetical protein